MSNWERIFVWVIGITVLLFLVFVAVVQWRFVSRYSSEMPLVKASVDAVATVQKTQAQSLADTKTGFDSLVTKVDVVDKKFADVLKTAQEANDAANKAKVAAENAANVSNETKKIAEKAVDSANMAGEMANDAKVAVDMGVSQILTGTVGSNSLMTLSEKVDWLVEKAANCFQCEAAQQVTVTAGCVVSYPVVANEPLTRTCQCTNWDELVSPWGIICWLSPGSVITTESDVFYSLSPSVNDAWTRVPGLGKVHQAVELDGGKRGLFIWAPWGIGVVVITETNEIQPCPDIPAVKAGQEPVKQIDIKPVGPNPPAVSAPVTSTAVLSDSCAFWIGKGDSPKGTVCFVAGGTSVWTKSDVETSLTKDGTFRPCAACGKEHEFVEFPGPIWIKTPYGASFFAAKP